MDKIYEELMKIFSKEKVLVKEPMSKHTSFRIGGEADYFIKVSTIEEVQKLHKLSKEINVPITIIGNGTNLLIRDKGVRGIVAKIDLQQIEIIDKQDNIIVKAGAGVPLARISKIAEENSLTGLEFACGIPGTLGGAIRMNAGAYGREIKDIVISTTYIDYKTGMLKTINKQEHEFNYRNSVFSKLGAIILETKLELKKGIKSDIQTKMNNNFKARKEKQPINYPNAGSAFKRGSDFITAQLIDECGLKGYRVGDAMVSTLHAGFIVNTGNATCDEVLELISHVKQKIKQKFDKEVELEILLLGEE